MWLLALMGCASGLIMLTDSGEQSAWENEDRGAPVDKLTYPDDTTNKILLYHGHGGMRADALDLETIKSAWVSDGWGVDQTAQWPLDLAPFRMIAMMSTGYRDTEASPFSDAQVSALGDAMERGTRIVFMAESAGCVTTNVNNLLPSLGVSIIFSGGNLSDHDAIIVDDLAAGSQVTEEISSLQLIGPCFLLADTDWLARTDERQPLAGAQRPGTGGDVVLLGDVDFLSDTNIGRSDNRAFALRLAQVTP